MGWGNPFGFEPSPLFSFPVAILLFREYDHRLKLGVDYYIIPEEALT